MRKVVDDQNLQIKAATNTPVDFQHSPTLASIADDELWDADIAQQRAMQQLRGKSIDQIVRLLLRLGLYDRLREAAR